MPPLLSAENISKSYGSKVLFKEISLALSSGDSIGLIGPNGSGKSSLLKILCGIDSADNGQITSQGGLKVGYIPQMSYYSEETPQDVLMKTLSKEAYLDDHECYTQTNIVLGRVGFKDSTVDLKTLSGGWKKRLDIANALVLNPDILLLDEPTNHLDIDGIEWLGDFLRRTNITYIIISHDRVFLENITTKIIELDHCYPQGIFAAEGSYTTFLERRQDFLEGQKQHQRSLSSKVRREIEWLRQTPQARSTKSRSRIQGANALIDELSVVSSRNKSTKTDINFSGTGRKTTKLLTAKNLTKAFGDNILFEDISLTLTPGMRIAIVGGNGTGKTTIMRAMAGELSCDSGTIKYADNLKIVYFDQHREKLPENISVRDALSPNGDQVLFQGRYIHVNSWGQRFLFTPDRLELPVSQLSGGEKARILIARLMTKSADIIFLDEPTNDLDISTLEILEDSLNSFQGAVVFITHDRYMLANLSTEVLGLGCKGKENFFADYYQWERYQKEQIKTKELSKVKTIVKTPIKKKLSYKEKLELENMEAAIASVENDIENKQKSLDDPIFSEDSGKLQEICQSLQQDQAELERLYDRWEELEDKKAQT